jgi:hypothetical protein
MSANECARAAPAHPSGGPDAGKSAVLDQKRRSEDRTAEAVALRLKVRGEREQRGREEVALGRTHCIFMTNAARLVNGHVEKIQIFERGLA